MPETVTLRVTGMTCGGCENAVRRAVMRIGGVLDVTASHADERVQVTCEGPACPRDAIVAAIEKIGYRVVQ
jgi:copper chaperone CopZ